MTRAPFLAALARELTLCGIPSPPPEALTPAGRERTARTRAGERSWCPAVDPSPAPALPRRHFLLAPAPPAGLYSGAPAAAGRSAVGEWADGGGDLRPRVEPGRVVS